LAENDIIIRDVTDKIHQMPAHENNEFTASSNKGENEGRLIKTLGYWRWLVGLSSSLKKKKGLFLIILFFLYHSTLFTIFFKPQYVFGFIW